MTNPVLNHLLANGPSTIDEIGAATHFSDERIWERLKRLTLSGHARGLARPNRAPVFSAVTTTGGCRICQIRSQRLAAGLCAYHLDMEQGIETPKDAPIKVERPLAVEPHSVETWGWAPAWPAKARH